MRSQCGADAADDRRVDFGCRRPVGAQRGDLAADPVQRVHRLPGVRVGADFLTQPGRGVVVEQTCLQIGEGVHGQRWIVIRTRLDSVHPPQCPSLVSRMHEHSTASG
jgi:hypothetical protein